MMHLCFKQSISQPPHCYYLVQIVSYHSVMGVVLLEVF